MRAVFCFCGVRLTAPDNPALFRVYREHVNTVHTERSLTDEQIRAVISANANELNEHGQQVRQAGDRH